MTSIATQPTQQGQQLQQPINAPSGSPSPPPKDAFRSAKKMADYIKKQYQEGIRRRMRHQTHDNLSRPGSLAISSALIIDAEPLHLGPDPLQDGMSPGHFDGIAEG